MGATVSSASRTNRLAIVPASQRALAPTGGTEWHQQTPSCASMLSSFGAIGAPGQDLRRLAVGPSLYVNGPPDKGQKATLATLVANRRDGFFAKEKLGPGNMITLLQMHPPACKRSMAGPDPYDTTLPNMWRNKQRLVVFQTEDGRPRSIAWQTLRADALDVADARRPPWVKLPQSRQMVHPPNRVRPSSRHRAWTPETNRPWPDILPT